MMWHWQMLSAVQALAHCVLGVALLAGAALLTRRSIEGASWMALAGFFELGLEIVQRAIPVVRHRLMMTSMNMLSFVQLGKLVLVFGAIALAIRALPAKVPT